MAKTVHVHIPYPILLKRLDEVLDESINPEVYIDGEYLDYVDPVDLKRVREGCERKGLEITMHGPYMEINPGSQDESVRLKAAGRYRKAFAVAEILCPKTIVLHAGYHEKKYKGDAEAWMQQSMKTWPEFVEKAEKTGVVIAAENIFEKGPATLKALVEKIGSPHFRVCIDMGHLSVFSNRDTEGWLKDLGPYVAEVHLHDNSGTNDDHLPLGEGSIDFRRFFSLLKTYAKDPVYTIEPHGEDAMRRAIAAVRKCIE